MSSRTLLCLFLASISLLPQAFAQDTTLTTYRQSYGRLLAIDRCAQRLQVSDIDSFSVGMSVLIIQHQGATIREENNAEFGTITDLGGAGRYEVNRITAIDADELVLAQRPRYDYRIDGTTQVVGVSPLDNATVTAPISPRAFDGETGGVLFFDVTDTLRLEAALRADGVGFRGGLGEIDPDENCTFLSSRSRYFYGADDERAARKGEGIARFIPGKEAGRGPQANGGGGGNAHNSGGGGGANVAVAGQGGENLEPDFFGCDGDFPGLSGRRLPATDTLLFFGGGGGAGHANNSAFGGGGNGGGVIVIRAAAIVFGSNGQISAAGTTAETIDGDGAGGGGSGGSIRLQYDTLIGTPNLSVRGGDGGNVDANGNRCQGPGGGGSGGWIGAATLLTGDLTGGSAGEVLASSACTDGNLTPQNGSPGLSVLLTDTLPTGIDTLQVDFDFSVTDLTVTFENLTTDSLATWLWDFGDTNTSTERDPVHTYTDPGSYLVTLTATDACGSVSASQEVNLIEDAAPAAAFTVDNASGCAPLTVQFTNQSLQAESYQWSFPGGSPATSTEPNPTVTFANAGTYIAQLFVSNALGSSQTSLSIEVGEPPVAAFDFTTTEQTVSFDASAAVGDAFAWEFGDGTTATGTTTTHTYPLDTLYTARLIVSSACGSDTLEQLIDLLPPLPTAAFATDPAVGCAPLQVQFTSQSEGVATYDWSFPGGTPATSNEVAPSVSYPAAGIYPVTLIVRNTAGADTLTLDEAIDVSTAPVADFTPGTPDGLTVAFTNNSTDATSFAWQFGDNSLSPEADPTHTFEGCGTYRVRLIASNPTCGADTTFQDIVISGCPVADFEQNLTSGCAPLAVQFSNTSTGEYETFTWTFPGGEPANSTEAIPIVIFSEPGSYEVVLELQSSFGTQVASQTIQVTAPPAPAFESTVSGLTVTFQNQTPEADSYSWDFGDGNSSNAVSPVHTYATGGVYTVSLNAQLGSCGKAVSRNVVVGGTNTEELARAGIRVFPNPVSDRIRVEGFAGGSLHLFSSDGRLVRRLEATGETTVLPREDLPAGMYWLRLVRNERVYGLALVLR